MATTQLQVYSGKRILLEYYNRVYRRNLQLSDVTFGIPQRVDVLNTNFNTTVRIYPNLGTRYYGSPRLNYDRIHVSYLGSISVPKGAAVRVHDLLDTINDKYNINLSEEDVENDLLDPIVNGEITVTLRIKQESVMFYDGSIIYTPNYPDPSNGEQPVIDEYGFWSNYNSSSNVVLSNNDYTALMNFEHLAITQIPIIEGNIYWEVKIDSGSLMIGIGLSSANKQSTGVPVVGSDATTWTLNTATGKLHHDNSVFNYTDPIAVGSTVGLLLDKNSGVLRYMVGNQILAIAFTELGDYSELYPIVSGADESNSSATANFGETPMFYTPPVNYIRGVYREYVNSGNNPVPPPYGGGNSTIPPAGTLLGTFCQEEDLWGVFADGSSAFNILIITPDSFDCQYDPLNPPVINGGDSGTGGVGPSMLSVVGGPFAVDEGSFIEIEFTISGIVTGALSLIFNRAFQTASVADVSSYGFRSESSPVFQTISDNDTVVIPQGDSNFFIRVNVNADLTTEGNELFTIILQEPVLGTLLGNTEPLITPVLINDTSLTPVDPPAPPPPPPSPPSGPASLYLDDYANNNKNFASTNLQDYYTADYESVNFTLYDNVNKSLNIGLTENTYDLSLRTKTPHFLSEGRFTLDYELSNMRIYDENGDSKTINYGTALLPGETYKQIAVEVILYSNTTTTWNLGVYFLICGEGLDYVEQMTSFKLSTKVPPYSSVSRVGPYSYINPTTPLVTNNKIVVEFKNVGTSKLIDFYFNNQLVLTYDTKNDPSTTHITDQTTLAFAPNIGSLNAEVVKIKKYQIDDLNTLPPADPPPLYLDDFVNNSKTAYQTITTWEDIYRQRDAGITADVTVAYVGTPVGSGYLSIKKPVYEDNINYWIWPRDINNVAQLRATFEMDIPKKQIYRNGGDMYVPMGEQLLTDGSETHTGSKVLFSIFGETTSVINAPLELVLFAPNEYNKVSYTRDGVGYGVAAPSPRKSGGTSIIVTIPETVEHKFVIEIVNDPIEGCKRSDLYLNDQLLRSTFHLTLGNNDLIMVALKPYEINIMGNNVDDTEIKLKKVLYEEII